jgi:hypothetical protein
MASGAARIRSAVRWAARITGLGCQSYTTALFLLSVPTKHLPPSHFSCRITLLGAPILRSDWSTTHMDPWREELYAEPREPKLQISCEHAA